MTLHANGNPVVFALVKLCWVAIVTTNEAVTASAGRPSANVSRYIGRVRHARHATSDTGLFVTGLVRKSREGLRKSQEAAQKRQAGSDDVRDPASSFQAVAVWEIVEVRSIIGGLRGAAGDAEQGEADQGECKRCLFKLHNINRPLA